MALKYPEGLKETGALGAALALVPLVIDKIPSGDLWKVVCSVSAVAASYIISRSFFKSCK